MDYGTRCPGFESRSCRYDFRDWLSPVSKSRCGWKIAKATQIFKTTNNQQPTSPPILVTLRKSDNTNNATKSSVTQRLRTDVRRPVGVTTATKLVWLTDLRAQPTYFPQQPCNQKDTHLKICDTITNCNNFIYIQWIIFIYILYRSLMIETYVKKITGKCIMSIHIMMSLISL